MSTELDVAVAEHVFGLTIVRIDEECSQYTPGARWVPGGEYYAVEVVYALPPDVVEQFEVGDRDDDGQWYLKPYSTDIAAAWTVVECLLAVDGPYGEQRWSFGLEHSSVVDWVCDFTPRRDHPKAREYPAFQAQEATAPMAICRAALLAVGDQVGRAALEASRAPT